MKKISAIILCLMIALGACGCEKPENSENFYKDEAPKVTASASDDTSSVADIEVNYDLSVPDYSEYFELGDLKDLKCEVDLSAYDVTDYAVLNEIGAEFNANIIDVTDRGIDYGDNINISLVGTIDGKEFEGGSVSNYTTLIGSNQIDLDIEKQLLGMKTGETKEIKHKFPDTFRDPIVAGKDVIYKVTVNGIRNYDMTVFTDEHVKEISSYSTFSDLKAAVKNDIEANKQSTKENDVYSIAMNEILNRSTVKGYPEDQLNTLMKDAEDAVAENAKAAGLTVEEYVKKEYNAQSYDEYKTSLKAQNEQYLANMMLVSAMAKAQGLAVTEKEYKDQIDLYKTTYNVSVDDLNKYYKSEDIIFSILIMKIKDWCLANVEVVDISPKID